MQITYTKTNKHKQVCTNYSGSYLNHAARYPSMLLTDCATGTQQKMHWNPKVREYVKQSSERQPDMGLTKWTRWKHDPGQQD